MSNIFPKEESTKSLIAHHWKDEFFCTIWNIKWFKFPHGCILHSKSFPTSTHTPKSELKRRSYGPDKLEKKNQLLSRKLCRDQIWCRNKPVSRQTCVENCVATCVATNVCHDQLAVSRPKTLQKLKNGRKVIF